MWKSRREWSRRKAREIAWLKKTNARTTSINHPRPIKAHTITHHHELVRVFYQQQSSERARLPDHPTQALDFRICAVVRGYDGHDDEQHKILTNNFIGPAAVRIPGSDTEDNSAICTTQD